MNENFNLITEKWIPVIPIGSSSPVRAGISDVLGAARQFQGISAPTPLETAAAYRLLLTVLNAALDITEDSWKSLWQDRTFENRDIREYLDRWSERFNLFDDKHPFYQDIMLNTKLESVSSLRGHIASGADGTLFDHNTSGQCLTLSPSDAALALLSIQAFGLGGTKGSGKSFTDASCARGIVVLVEGSSLFDTLLLNLFDRDLRQHRLKRQANDRPAWEMDDPFLNDPRRPYGLLDHLTWHNRRVRLIPKRHATDQVKVSDMMYDIGLRTSDLADNSVRDVFNPLHYWHANTRKKTGSDAGNRSHSPMRFEQEKALWRDSAVLFRVEKAGTDDADKPPAALVQVQELAQQGILAWTQSFQLMAIGACTDPGHDKTYFYRYETLPLPVSFLHPNDTSLLGHLSESLASASKAKDALAWSVRVIARIILKPSLTLGELNDEPKKEDRARLMMLAESWGVERIFWSNLEHHFHRLIQDLPDKPEAAVQEWRQVVRTTAKTAFAQAESYAGSDLRAQRAAALARQLFDRRLAAALGIASVTDNTIGGDQT